uniref:Uncharacterized protein n=1 Tax=viral metagenome TaxID=1070528 RepID=A0A6H1ZUK1_9ZZZZ
MSPKKTTKKVVKEVEAPEVEEVTLAEEVVEEKPKKAKKTKEPELVTVKIHGLKVTGLVHGDKIVSTEGVTYTYPPHVAK